MRFRRYISLLCLLFILAAGVHAELTVHIIDVGQGDAHLLQSSGHFMLIDAGPESEGRNVVSYITNFGIQTIDYIVATGTGEDHIGGMEEVLRAVHAGTYYDGGNPNPGQEYADIMNRLATDQTAYSNETEGRSFLFGDVTVEFIKTPDQSVNGTTALKVTDGSVTWLFPGDDESVVVPATILILANHGSPGSVANIAAINPKVAVISVDANKTPGFPDKKTLGILKTGGITVNRTDLNGNIVITSDGSGYTVTPEKESKEQPSVVRTGVSTPVPTPVKTPEPGYNQTKPVPAFSPVTGPDWKKFAEKFNQTDREEIMGFINGSIPFSRINWKSFGEKFNESELKDLEKYQQTLRNITSDYLIHQDGRMNATAFAKLSGYGGTGSALNSSFHG